MTPVKTIVAVARLTPSPSRLVFNSRSFCPRRSEVVLEPEIAGFGAKRETSTITAIGRIIERTMSNSKLTLGSSR